MSLLVIAVVHHKSAKVATGGVAGVTRVVSRFKFTDGNVAIKMEGLIGGKVAGKVGKYSGRQQSSLSQGREVFM